MIQIDNQHDLNEAIKTILSEQKSTTLKLILAQTHKEAMDMLSLAESMRLNTNKFVPMNYTSSF